MHKQEHKIYTADEILRYVQGKMTSSEMHAIEKAAMDDSFLAEAIEGYHELEPQSATSFIDLRSAIQRKTTGGQAKVIPLHASKTNYRRFAIAAAILLILSLSAYFTIFDKNKNDNSTVTLARNVEHKPARDMSTPEQRTDIVSADPTLSGIPSPKPEEFIPPAIDVKTAPVKPYFEDQQKPDKSENDLTKDQVATIETKKQIETTLTQEVTEDKTLAQKDNLQEHNEMQANKLPLKQVASRDYDIADLNKLFVAQVVGADDSPLPFANINVRPEKFGTYADAKGNFRLISADSLLEVEVRSVGYKTKYIVLKSDPDLRKIVLDEDKMAMQNIATGTNATALNRQQVRGRFVKDSAENVEPADGWSSYSAYVDNNIQVPETVIDRDIKGMVEISFDVKRNGSISNAKVDKSLCNDCDEEALRLIKQGPQWKVKKGRKGKSKVKVRF